MKQRFSFIFLCFVLISFGVASVSAQIYTNDGYFRPNGTYDANRRLILSSLPSSVTAQDGLFYNGSLGQEPDRVFAVGMCISGSTSENCSDCIKGAFDGLIQSCPNRTEAYWWPGKPTLCLVRYSNTSFSGTAYLDPQVLFFNTGDIRSNHTKFTDIWEELVGRMIAAASTAKSTPSSSDNHYTANVAALTPSQNIYALMQCTPDISSGDCDSCLRRSASDYQSCCGQKQGGLVLRPSCLFKWDLHMFYKAFDNLSVASSPPPVTVPQPRPAGDRANTTENEQDGKGVSAGIVAAITVPTVVTILILLVLAFVLYRRRRSYQRSKDWMLLIVIFQLEIQRNKLGEGGFGEVYKGKLSNGTEVAVKRLSKKSGQGTREFRNEAVLVSKLQHRNLVRLLGFCVEGEEKILIYEFVPNKSLDYILFDPEKQGQLEWTQRYKIIGGIARGILYLHQDSRLTIIHRDLKASNVLLDANMNPKVADFGLSTIFVTEQTRGNTNRIVGTYVYMSPEYALHGQYSMKSDIYSFGVLILEIISGKKNSGVYQMDETSTAGNLVSNVWRLWRNGSQLELVDLAIGRNYQGGEVTRCIHIAPLCVQENPEDRPVLSTIVLMLTSNIITLPLPRLPKFDPQSWRKLNHVFRGSESARRSVCYSVNDVSITDLEPR